eukprot:TRINITY_DN1308_c0_g2_i3.p1 TRINITY_DN1308_c0_g2~~TRINITY_DN1308_c0_g2_i3.p1  ORF type:complete len:602 (+),score=76.88 TRINITY_DN1308_c0_g2_i3:671-2476(+)
MLRLLVQRSSGILREGANNKHKKELTALWKRAANGHVKYRTMDSKDITACINALSRSSAVEAGHGIIAVEVLPQLLQRANYLRDKFDDSEIETILMVLNFADARDRTALINTAKKMVIQNKVPNPRTAINLITGLSKLHCQIPDSICLPAAKRYFDKRANLRYREIARLLHSSQKGRQLETHHLCIDLLAGVKSPELVTVEEKHRLGVAQTLVKSYSMVRSEYIAKVSSIIIGIVRLDIPATGTYLPALVRACNKIPARNKPPIAPHFGRLLERNRLTIHQTYKALPVTDLVSLLKAYERHNNGSLLTTSIVKPALRIIFVHLKEKGLPLQTASATISFLDCWLKHPNRGTNQNNNPRLEELIRQHAPKSAPTTTSNETSFKTNTRELVIVAKLIENARLQIMNIISKARGPSKSIDPHISKSIVHMVQASSKFDSGRLLFCQVMSPLVITKLSLATWEQVTLVASLNKLQMGRWKPDTFRIKNQLSVVVDGLLKLPKKPTIKQMSDLVLDLKGGPDSLAPKLSWELTMHAGTEMKNLSEPEILVSIRAAVEIESMQDLLHMILPLILARRLSRQCSSSLRTILTRARNSELRAYLDKLPK